MKEKKKVIHHFIYSCLYLNLCLASTFNFPHLIGKSMVKIQVGLSKIGIYREKKYFGKSGIHHSWQIILLLAKFLNIGCFWDST